MQSTPFEYSPPGSGAYGPRPAGRGAADGQSAAVVWFSIGAAGLVLLGLGVLIVSSFVSGLISNGGESGAARLVVEAPAVERGGLLILIDGRSQPIPASGPLEFRVAAGRRELEVRRPGYEPFRSSLSLSPADRKAVRPVWRSLAGAEPPKSAPAASAGLARSMTSEAAAKTETAGGQKMLSVQAATNVHGAVITVRDASTGEEVASKDLKGERACRFQLRPGRQYECEARVGRHVISKRVTQSGVVLLPFGREVVREICREATCLILLPDGALGSGFLFGDRRTIVTAAHVVTTKSVENVDIIFDPAEDERRYKSAQLIYFDAKQDVALLRLPTPVADERLFLWPMEQKPETPRVRVEYRQGLDGRRETRVEQLFHEVFVVGNPGRGDDYDPLYTREAKIVAGRPDEFQVDIELKPGYSGGPVCLVATAEVAGLVSYKIVAGAKYQDVGRSFAKSVSLAHDALDNWNRMTPSSQQARIDRLASQFARLYGYRCALNAATHLYLDSAVYVTICIDVAVDFNNYMVRATGALSPNLPQRVLNVKINQLRSAYMAKQAPKRAREVREKVTPRLCEQTLKWYREAIDDPQLPDTMKTDLKDAYDGYNRLKERAETIDSPKQTQDTDIREFLEEIADYWKNVSASSASVAEEAMMRME